MLSKHSEQPRITLVEWIVAGAGAAIVVGVLLFLLFHIADEQTPPDIHLTVDSVHAGPNYLVEVDVVNRGTRAAADMSIEGELLSDAGVAVETSSATLDYLPGRAKRRVGLFFQQDPRAHRLQLRATGYREP